jgi:hypothetical protein
MFRHQIVDDDCFGARLEPALPSAAKVILNQIPAVGFLPIKQWSITAHRRT